MAMETPIFYDHFPSPANHQHPARNPEAKLSSTIGLRENLRGTMVFAHIFGDLDLGKSWACKHWKIKNIYCAIFLHYSFSFFCHLLLQLFVISVLRCHFFVILFCILLSFWFRECKRNAWKMQNKCKQNDSKSEKKGKMRKKKKHAKKCEMQKQCEKMRKNAKRMTPVLAKSRFWTFQVGSRSRHLRLDDKTARKWQKNDKQMTQVLVKCQFLDFPGRLRV